MFLVKILATKQERLLFATTYILIYGLLTTSLTYPKKTLYRRKERIIDPRMIAVVVKGSLAKKKRKNACCCYSSLPWKQEE